MNYTIEKNEQYALISLHETEFTESLSATFEALSRNLFRDEYNNIIVNLTMVQAIDSSGLDIIRWVNRQCISESGLFILVTKNSQVIDFLDSSKIADLTILPTVEEAIDAVFMNDLENDFRNEDDDSYEGFEGSQASEY